MRKEVECNRHAWSQISEDHYHAFRQSLLQGTHGLNRYIESELGDLSGKSVIHLQCNTGADTILLAQRAAEVTGVDLVPQNIHYAKKLAEDCGQTNLTFLESDILEFAGKHDRQYDVVFVSEGAIGWLPDLATWARTIRGLLRDDGYLYVFDIHPFYLTLDDEQYSKGTPWIKYPYFGKNPDVENTIGGYASEPRGGVEAYFWVYTVSGLINSLTNAGLHIEFFNEFPELFYDGGGMQKQEGQGLYTYPHNADKLPMSFSLKATVYQK